MSDDQPRSVLDRVSQWLGRKKESNPEEHGDLPASMENQSQENQPVKTARPQALKSAPAPAKDRQADPAEEAGATSEQEKKARSASARRREQRARAKARAAAKTASDNGETDHAPPEAPLEAALAPAEAEARKAAPASKSGGRTRSRTRSKTPRPPAAKASGDEAPRPLPTPGSAAVDTSALPEESAASAAAVAVVAAAVPVTTPAAKARQAKVKAKAKTTGKPAASAPAKATSGKAAAREEEETGKAVAGTGNYKLLINTDEPEECRLALVENGKVEGFFIESVSGAQCKGNIYKGRITSVEANLQAAFVDIGLAKNGFLSFSEIHPEYYDKEVDPETHWKSLKIQDLVKKGREVLVEVVKEATGNKGPSLTTYLSLPGRFLVLMPGSDSAGISRKIDDEEQRRKLREMVEGLNIPEGIGYIVRTASQEITKTALTQDLRYLTNLWNEIKKTGQEAPAPALLYKEQNIISRFLRDHYTTEIREILVDNEEAAQQVRDFLQLLPAAQRKKTAVKLHQGSQPIFHQYHVEKQIEQMFQPTVPLASGGSIVINPTEALVAIDVNSGRTASKDRDFEESIFIANMEAAEELARQLRMRDLGGLIVVDFIDMRSAAHTREVEKKVRECMKKDKAKVDFSKISKFGLMQISRQKMAAPIQTTSYKTCPCCEGRGMIRSVENLALSHLRQLQTGLSRRGIKKVQCRLPLEVAHYILNKKREDLLELEKEYQAEIFIEADQTMMPADGKLDFIKSD